MLLERIEKIKNEDAITGIGSIIDIDFLLARLKSFFIQEIAGRDSIAALNRFLETAEARKFDGVIISAAFAPTEYGDLKYINDAMLYAAEIAKKNSLQYVFSVSIHRMIWERLVSRPSFSISKKYGFYTPCIACHLYLHILRAIIAVQTGSELIVSGERARHRGLIKLNQHPEALKAYQKVISSRNINLVYPVENVDDENEILSLVGKDWKEGGLQLSCLFTGSSKVTDEEFNELFNNFSKFLDEFLIPEGISCLDEYA